MKGLSKGRYDKTFAGEDGIIGVAVLVGRFCFFSWVGKYHIDMRA